ncbi:c-factor [Aphelenchoides avenae]|nr:c-factor [Aphelenchus avenae]
MAIGRSVFVTGANRGIGLALVQQLVKCEGVKQVFAGCRSPTLAEDLRALRAKYSSVEIVQIDLQRDDYIREAVKTLEARLCSDGLNLLINNAGIQHKANRRVYLEHLDVNVVGHIVLTSKLLHLLRMAASFGQPSRIVNVGSSLGSNAVIAKHMYKNNAYEMSKAALNHYTSAMSGALRGDRVSVVSINPGWVHSGAGGPRAPLMPEQAAEAMVKTIAGLTLEDSGRFIERDGQDIPF